MVSSSSLLLVGLLPLALCAPAIPSVQLLNAALPGTAMPVLGLGTGAYGNSAGVNGECWNNGQLVAWNAVNQYLSLGGRRIDTSMSYGDLDQVGWAVGNSTIPRSELFVTTKVDVPFGYNTTVQHIQQSFNLSGLEYFDLLLIHWPGPQGTPTTPDDIWCHENGPLCRQQTWLALEETFKAGKARAIGVSNFEQRHIEDILALKSLVPSVNQVEYHAYWHDDDLAAYCASMNITFNAYAPLGAPDHMGWQLQKWPIPLLNQPAVLTIAGAHQRTPAQILLQWVFQKVPVTNPRSANPAHMAEALALFDPATAFTLSAAEMKVLDNLPAPVNNKICGDPNAIP